MSRALFKSFTISCSIRGTMAASGQNIAATVTCNGFGESGKRCGRLPPNGIRAGTRSTHGTQLNGVHDH